MLDQSTRLKIYRIRSLLSITKNKPNLMKNRNPIKYFNSLRIYVFLVIYTSNLLRSKNTKTVFILDFPSKSKRLIKAFCTFTNKSFTTDSFLTDINMGSEFKLILTNSLSIRDSSNKATKMVNFLFKKRIKNISDICKMVSIKGKEG